MVTEQFHHQILRSIGIQRNFHLRRCAHVYAFILACLIYCNAAQLNHLSKVIRLEDTCTLAVPFQSHVLKYCGVVREKKTPTCTYKWICTIVHTCINTYLNKYMQAHMENTLQCNILRFLG